MLPNKLLEICVHVYFDGISHGKMNYIYIYVSMYLCMYVCMYACTWFKECQSHLRMIYKQTHKSWKWSGLVNFSYAVVMHIFWRHVDDIFPWNDACLILGGLLIQCLKFTSSLPTTLSGTYDTMKKIIKMPWIQKIAMETGPFTDDLPIFSLSLSIAFRPNSIYIYINHHSNYHQNHRGME